jgi:polyferredoxin
VLLLKDPDRQRILSAVSSRGAAFQLTRVAVITVSQVILLAVPLMGWVRLDLWQGNHLLLGEAVGLTDALKGFVVALSIMWGFTFATNLIVGRFFCGWGCPVGYVSRLGEDADRTKRKKLRWMFSHLSGAAFVATFVGAIMLWWVDPMVMVEGSAAARATVAGVFLVLSAGGFLHAFVWRFGFCRVACPIGLYYRFVTSSTPVGIVFRQDPSPCIECGACEKICPVDLDPKRLGETQFIPNLRGNETMERYGDAECIRCGDCVEACRMIYKGRPGEVPPMRFGRPDADDPGPCMGGGASVAAPPQSADSSG